MTVHVICGTTGGISDVLRGTNGLGVTVHLYVPVVQMVV